MTPDNCAVGESASASAAVAPSVWPSDDVKSVTGLSPSSRMPSVKIVTA